LGLDRPPSDRKQYGAVLGGPIIKNKTLLRLLPALLRETDPDVLDDPLPHREDVGGRLL
jgi:hypothetical protein